MPDLFEQTSIGGMNLANRFVRSATWEGMADKDLFLFHSRGLRLARYLQLWMLMLRDPEKLREPLFIYPLVYRSRHFAKNSESGYIPFYKICTYINEETTRKEGRRHGNFDRKSVG